MPMDQAEMTVLLERLVRSLYTAGVVPPAEGGLLFRTVCEERRRHGDLFWTERRIHDLARRLGLWPWSLVQIQAGFGSRSPATNAGE